MAAPVLMFGVGAAKSGTSWLYRYLAEHPECHLRSIKELHFFDGRGQGERDWHLRQLTRKSDALERQIASSNGEAPLGQIVHLAEMRLYARVLGEGRTSGYMAFLMDGRDEERVVGDITPSYALLSEATLREMARLHDDVRFVYLMRDPVERLWSHVRMISARRSPGAPGRLTGRILDDVLGGRAKDIADRSDYAGALERLTAAIDPAKLFVATYEDLFAGDVLARLCAFLGIAALPGSIDRKVHPGVSIAMTDEQRRRARAWLRPQYDYVAANLGALPPSWQASLAGI